MAFIPVEYREQWEPSSLSQHAMALRCTLTALNGDLAAQRHGGCHSDCVS